MRNSVLMRRLGALPPPVVTLLAFGLVLVLGAIDLATGEEISFSVFYTVPVSLTAWFCGWRSAVAIAFLSAGTWLSADLLAGATYSAAWIPFWNASVRLAFFLIIADLLVLLRAALERQRSLAEVDGLTGLANTRRFLAAVRSEAARTARYGRAVSLAYIDLDGFKAVNDQWGHAVGDDVLGVVGRTLREHVRATDLPARLGGDEFAILFPETDAEAVREATEKVRAALHEAMTTAGWPVGFSIGVYTSSGRIDDPEELIRRADRLMYEVKRSGKGRTSFQSERPASRGA